MAKKYGVEDTDKMGKGKLIDEIFGETCEGSFIQPTFITDYPVEMSPLTKMHRSKAGLTERFELMVNGKELANAYSELNDPIDQYNRFVEQMKLADKGDDEAMVIDHDFMRALEYGIFSASKSDFLPMFNGILPTGSFMGVMKNIACIFLSLKVTVGYTRSSIAKIHCRLIDCHRIEGSKHTDIRQDRSIIIPVTITIRRDIVQYADMEVGSAGKDGGSIFRSFFIQQTVCLIPGGL